MEHSGSLPDGLLDLGGWLPVLERTSPAVTVSLGTPAIEQAGQRNWTAWSDLRADVAAAGAPEAALSAIDEVVGEAHRHGRGLAALADEQGIVRLEHAPVPPRHELARWGMPPSIGPFLDWQQHRPTYVVALVDRQGADLVASGAATPDVVREVQGSSSLPVHAATGAGGPGEDHHQQRAVESWEHNARDVADELTRLTESTSPSIVLLAGDPTAVELLRSALPAHLQEQVQVVAGSRAADSGGDATAVEVSRAVNTVAASTTVAVIEAFKQQLGRHGRAAEGMAAVFDALRQSQVAALLIHDDPADDRRAWFGAAPGLVAGSETELDGLGGGAIAEGRLVDVALRAAAQTAAPVRLVPRGGGPVDGIGALLRWA